jgi:hypothetical protein
MEYFRFWRIYLSGVVVSDLPGGKEDFLLSDFPLPFGGSRFEYVCVAEYSSKNLSLTIWPSRVRTQRLF